MGRGPEGAHGGSAQADPPPPGSTSEDAARFIAALRSELSAASRELRLVASARWARVVLGFQEHALGLLALFVGLAAVTTVAVVGALGLSRGVFHGLLAWTESVWLAELLQGVLLLALAYGAFAFVRWNIGRAAVRRFEAKAAEEKSPPPTSTPNQP